MINKLSVKGVFLAFLLGGITGCVAPKQTVLDCDSNESIKHFQEPVCEETHKDYALQELVRAELFHNNGDRQHSDERFRNALGVMEQIESDSREAAGTMIAENMRTYRGQPYERATAYFYRGLCHFELGHYERALAAFRATLAEDEETNNDDPVKRKDYLGAYYMQAQCLKLLGEDQEAKAVLASARELSANHPLFTSNNSEGNLIVVAGVGYGPWMMQGAFWTVKFQAGTVPGGDILVANQQNELGRLYEVVDLLDQAESNKAGGSTGAAVGRAVAKEAINILGAVAGVNPGLEEKRDLRCWAGMPRKFYIRSFNLEPGLHTLSFTIAPKSTKKNEDANVSRYQQVWYDIPVNKGDEPQLLFVRMLPNSQNYYERVPVSLETALAAKRVNEEAK